MEMAINLLEECGRKGESKYAPYIASLPNPEELVLPLQWPSGAMLKNVIFAEAVELVRTWRERTLEDPAMIARLNEDTNLNIKSLAWALNIIQTRNCKCTSFSSWYLKSSGSNVNILAPIFDLLNHSDDAKTAFYQSDGFLCLDTMAGYAKDEEVFLNYGEHCPHTLLAKYGFWSDVSPKNVLPVLLPRKMTLPLLLEGGEERLELLQSMDVLISGTFHLLRDGVVPHNLMLALMVIKATDTEIEQMLMLMATKFEVFECIFDADNENEDDDECGRRACESLVKLVMENLEFSNKLQKASMNMLVNVLEEMKEEDNEPGSAVGVPKDMAEEVMESMQSTKRGFMEYKLGLISDVVKNVCEKYECEDAVFLTRTIDNDYEDIEDESDDEETTPLDTLVVRSNITTIL